MQNNVRQWIISLHVSPVQNLLLRFIADEIEQKDKVIITYKNIAAETALCLRAVHKNMKILIDKGYIIKEKRRSPIRGGVPNAYTLNCK